MSDRPVLETTLAHAEWNDHILRRHRIFKDLLGHCDFWNLLSIAMNGPGIDEAGLAVIHRICVSVTAADPRLPPMKIVRLASCYGGTMAAIGAGLVYQEDASIGTWTAGRAAQFLMDIAAEIGDQEMTPSSVERSMRALISKGAKLAGCGVPARKEDERAQALRHAMVEIGQVGGDFWMLMNIADGVFRKVARSPINISGVVAALFLDLGFNPRQIAVLGMVISQAAFIANALEGAEQAPEVLRKIPDEWIAYQGPAPRPSPRAVPRPSG